MNSIEPGVRPVRNRTLAAKLLDPNNDADPALKEHQKAREPLSTASTQSVIDSGSADHENAINTQKEPTAPSSVISIASDKSESSDEQPIAPRNRTYDI